MIYYIWFSGFLVFVNYTKKRAETYSDSLLFFHEPGKSLFLLHRKTVAGRRAVMLPGL